MGYGTPLPFYCMHSVTVRHVDSDGVAWCVCVSVGNDREPCKMDEPISVNG